MSRVLDGEAIDMLAREINRVSEGADAVVMLSRARDFQRCSGVPSS